jgi:hypothetical protein
MGERDAGLRVAYDGWLQFEDQQTRDHIRCDDANTHCNSSTFVLAQTASGQAGVVHVAISEGWQYGTTCTSRPDLGSGPKCTGWLLRTKYAVMIPHEVRAMGGPDLCGGAGVPASPDGEFAAAPCPVAVPTILLDFGYADPLCDMYRYFDDEELPIATSGAAALALLVQDRPRNHTDGRSDDVGSMRK